MPVATKTITGPKVEVLPGLIIQGSDLIITVSLIDSDLGIVDVSIEHTMSTWHGGVMAIPHPHAWDSDRTFNAALTLAQVAVANNPHSRYAARIAAFLGEQNDHS